jgi:BirA family biotin operon repressor/biotin-[acetyl-CoA-carboxylase] ligase
VVASFQSDGRGRRENEWQSNPGENLLCSFLVSDFDIDLLPRLNFAASISIVQCLEKFGVKNTSIKWPNDVYVGDRKIAGILIENVLVKNIVKHSVVGIGLNINQTEFNQLEATSLKIAMGKQFDIRQIAEYLYKSFYYFIQQTEVNLLKNVNFQLYKKNSIVTFTGYKGLNNYRVIRVMANGNLQVQDDKGQLIELQHHLHQWVK